MGFQVLGMHGDAVGGWEAGRVPGELAWNSTSSGSVKPRSTGASTSFRKAIPSSFPKPILTPKPFFKRAMSETSQKFTEHCASHCC